MPSILLNKLRQQYKLHFQFQLAINNRIFQLLQHNTTDPTILYLAFLCLDNH
jgi:transcriptional regulatory protein LevR